MNDVVLREGLGPLRSLRFDVLAFATALAAGVIVMFVFHFLKVPQEITTAVIVVIMIAYAVAAARVPRMRVRLDQAGDNGYYLGLLFTLVSMAFALFDFGRAIDAPGAGSSGARQIIANFGIALWSTITGIAIRVLLNQMRVDPADVESMTRIELAEASRVVKSKLDAVSTDMGLFHSEIQQRTGDVVITLLEDVQKTLGSFTAEVASATQRLLSETAKAQEDVGRQSQQVIQQLTLMVDETREAILRLAAVEAPPTKLATRLDKVTGSLEKLDAQLQGLGESVVPARDALQAAADALSAAGREVTELSRSGRATEAEIVATISRAATSLAAELQRAGETLQADRAVLEGLEQQARASAAEVRSVGEAANDVLGNLVTATDRLAALVAAPEPVKGG
jgi:hypothetical protein